MMLVTYAFQESAALPGPNRCVACLRSIPRWLRENQLTTTRKPREWSALKNLQ